MRKSAVSVGSEAGMPAHMARERNTQKKRCKKKSVRGSLTQYMSVHYIRDISRL